MRKYLLDTSVLIAAKKKHYGMDFCPAFWEWLVSANRSNIVNSVEAVYDELATGSDELSDWANERGEAFFLQADDATLKSMKRISHWVVSQNYTQSAVADFLAVADYALVACAHAHKFTVVTHEIRTNQTTKVKIPNVCEAFQVEVTDPFAMLRAEKARFVL